MVIVVDTLITIWVWLIVVLWKNWVKQHKYNKQTYPKPLQQQQQQGAPTYKQTSYKPQYAKQTYSQTPSSQQYAQADRGKSKNYKPTTPSNQYKKKTVNKTVNVNQQPRRSRWGLGGFRSMWHIPMIFMFWRGFSKTVTNHNHNLNRTSQSMSPI